MPLQRTKAQMRCEHVVTILSGDFHVCDDNPWVLIFSEDFNQVEIDNNKWFTENWRNLYCNNEQQYYSSDNVSINQGILELTAKEETIYARADDNYGDNDILPCGGVNLRTFNYTSGMIQSKKKFHFGKYEAKVKIPKGKGFWPAFWLWGDNPRYNELDIFEFWNEKNFFGNYDSDLLSKVINTTVHFDHDGNRRRCGESFRGIDYSKEFHVFSVIWEQDKIQWFIDDYLIRIDYRYKALTGQLVGCTIFGGTYYVESKVFPKDPMHIFLNLAIQGGSESPDNETLFPANLQVEWVKYYQKNSCQDYIFDDCQSINLDSENFNLYAGNSIKINCEFNLNQNEQLDLIGNSSITLNPGVNINSGSVFEGRIDEYCTTKNSKKVEYQFYNFVEDTEQIASNKATQNFIQYPLLYPNPNNGKFQIQFNSNNQKGEFYFTIMSTLGEIIFEQKVTKNLEFYDFSNLSPGIYFINIIDQVSNNLVRKRIIIQ